MIYSDRLTPSNNWPPLIRYPKYYPERRLSTLWFLAFAIVALTLSVIALIIVFAVEHSWFHDSYLGSEVRYGLWRLCFVADNACDSWFSTNGYLSAKISDRLAVSKAGINAWQALEIIFLFLTTATLLVAVVALICYRMRNSFHYYLAILAIFCAWPAACIGISVLFVFGFSVYNVSAFPRDLDWCFYLNLAAVILALIGAILLSIYDALLKKPIRSMEDDTVVETFPDLNGHPAALSPSTFVIVRRNKKKRNQPYEYPQILYPNRYLPTSTTNGIITNKGSNIEYRPNPVHQSPVVTTTTVIANVDSNVEYRSNPNHQSVQPYTSIVTTQETNTSNNQQRIQPSSPYRSFDYNHTNLVTSPSVTTIVPQPPIPIQSQSYRTPVSSYQYQSRPSPPNWHRTGTNAIDRSIAYTSEPSNDYIQRDFLFPSRSNIIERSFEQKQEPRVLHYYTGYDYFATVDPTDTVVTRHHQPITRPGSTIRYSGTPTYYQDDYIKTTM